MKEGLFDYSTFKKKKIPVPKPIVKAVLNAPAEKANEKVEAEKEVEDVSIFEELFKDDPMFRPPEKNEEVKGQELP